jgi:hypothetical protein
LNIGWYEYVYPAWQIIGAVSRYERPAGGSCSFELVVFGSIVFFAA